MISKNFSSGIFSVVSFILISNLAIPSTFAQCPPDVSGTWVYKVVMSECCPDPSDNGLSKEKQSTVIAQIGNEISASWVDEDNDQHVLTGTVNGNSVYGKIEVTDLDEPPGCVEVNHLVGIIKGNRIDGNFSRNGLYDTCRGHGKFRVKIVK